MAHEPNAILAINSLDRCISGSAQQPLGSALNAIFLQIAPPCNNLQIQSPGALIYGYIDKIVVSQIQLQYGVPTVIPGRNDKFWIFQGGNPTPSFAEITIPFGFYTPTELAAVLQALILNTNIGSLAPNFRVTYNVATNRFIFESQTINYLFFFPTLFELETALSPNFSLADYQDLLKTYTLLGMSNENTDKLTGVGLTTQGSTNTPTFLYTPYVDIISETLTKYQNVKDTDSSAQKLNSMVSRIYLSGIGIPQAVNAEPVGSRPFVFTQDLNSPKVIRWSRDEAVNTLDFQLRDQYGDLLFTTGASTGGGRPIVYNTEFQMTLLCVEKNRY